MAWKNWNPHTVLVGIENRAAAWEHNLAVSQKVKHRVTTQLNNFIPGYVPEEL